MVCGIGVASPTLTTDQPVTHVILVGKHFMDEFIQHSPMQCDKDENMTTFH